MGTVVLDMSGNGNNGAVYGCSWELGKYDNCLYFDGSSYVEILNNASLNPTSITVCLWFKLDSAVAWKEAISKRYEEQFHISFWDPGTKPFFECNTVGGGWDYTAISPVIVADTWVFLAGRYNSTSGKIALFVDGVKYEKDHNFGGDLVTQTDNLILGGRTNGSGFITGWIDEVRIYDRALSDSEVNDVYNYDSSVLSTDEVLGIAFIFILVFFCIAVGIALSQRR